MNKPMSIFRQAIKNTLTFKGTNKDRSNDDFTKEYSKKKWFLGIKIFDHHFEENISTEDIKTEGIGFNNKTNGN